MYVPSGQDHTYVMAVTATIIYGSAQSLKRISNHPSTIHVTKSSKNTEISKQQPYWLRSWGRKTIPRGSSPCRHCITSIQSQSVQGNSWQSTQNTRECEPECGQLFISQESYIMNTQQCGLCHGSSCYLGCKHGYSPHDSEVFCLSFCHVVQIQGTSFGDSGH